MTEPMCVLESTQINATTTDGSVSTCLTASMGTGGGYVPMIVIAIHEASGQDVTLMEDVAYSLVVGGGKPGQGYPCVITEIDDEETNNPHREEVL